MSRRALLIVLCIAGVVGLICAVDPQLDIDIAGISFDPAKTLFGVNAQPWVQHTRDAARLVITLLVLPAFLAVIGKLLFPHRRMLIEGRSALFLIATLALGPGVLTNVVLKEHWGRSRPIDVQQYGGTDHFVPWWDPRGECPENCSFIAGEPSGAFWTLAPAALAPPELQPLAYGLAILFGIGMGALRIAGGAHFFSDVVFAGVLTYLVVWLSYAFIYRWPSTRISEEAIDLFLTRAGEALHRAVSGVGGLAKRLFERGGKKAAS